MALPVCWIADRPDRFERCIARGCAVTPEALRCMAERGHLQLLQLIVARHRAQPFDVANLHRIVCAGAVCYNDEAMERWAWTWLPPLRRRSSSDPYWATAF
jgi:hypothetical protein